MQAPLEDMMALIEHLKTIQPGYVSAEKVTVPALYLQELAVKAGQADYFRACLEIQQQAYDHMVAAFQHILNKYEMKRAMKSQSTISTQTLQTFTETVDAPCCGMPEIGDDVTPQPQPILASVEGKHWDEYDEEMEFPDPEAPVSEAVVEAPVVDTPAVVEAPAVVDTPAVVEAPVSEAVVEAPAVDPKTEECEHGADCTNYRCPNIHPKNRPPLCPKGSKCTDPQCRLSNIHDKPNCFSGDQCTNPNCTAYHGLPPTRYCRWGVNCNRFDCWYAHPSGRREKCQSEDCSDANCKKLHKFVPKQPAPVTFADYLQ